jgi:hypothetical protein
VYLLKNQGINSGWPEIVRIANTQKVITTAGTNAYNKIIITIKCSRLNETRTNICNILKIKYQAFTKRKSVIHKLELKNDQTKQKLILQHG